MSSRYRVLSLAWVVAALAVPAWAHGGVDAYELRPVADKPSMEGLTVQAIQSNAPQLILENRSDQTLEVLDDDGRAFLRIGPGGVEGDLNAAAFYNTYSTAGLQPPEAAQDAESDPAWTALSENSYWGWFDPRIAETVVEPSHEDVDRARSTGKAVMVKSWAVPVRFGNATRTITGQFELTAGEVVKPIAEIETGMPTGWSARVLQGTNPAIMVKRSGGQTDPGTVIVLGERDEPYIRLSDHGVCVNIASETWRRYGRSNGEFSDLSAVSADEPDWMHVSDSATYAFMHPALVVRQDALPEDVLRWTVPVELNGDRSAIGGSTRFELASDGGGG